MPWRNLNPNQKTSMLSTVPMTLDQIVEETRQLTREQVAELMERLAEDLRASDPETDAAWKTEVDRRVAEIQSGQVQGIPLEESFARIRKIAGL